MRSSQTVDALNKELINIQQKLKIELLKEKELNEKIKDIDKELEENSKDLSKSFNKLGVQKKEIEKCTKEIDGKTEKLKKKISALKGKEIEVENSLNEVQEAIITKREKHSKSIRGKIISTEENIDQDKIKATIKHLIALRGKLEHRNSILDQKAKALEQDIYLMKSQRDELMMKEQDLKDMLKEIEEEEIIIEKKEKELEKKEARVIPSFGLDEEIDVKTEEFEKTSIKWQRYKEKCYKLLTETYRKLKNKGQTLRNTNTK